MMRAVHRLAGVFLSLSLAASLAPQCLVNLTGVWSQYRNPVFHIRSWRYSSDAAALQKGCSIIDYGTDRRNETKALAPRLVFLSDSIDAFQTIAACRMLQGQYEKESVHFVKSPQRFTSSLLCHFPEGFHIQQTYITSLSDEIDPLQRPTKVDDAAAVYAKFAGNSGPPHVVVVAVNFWELYYVLRHTHPQWLMSKHIPKASLTWYQQNLEAFLRRVQQVFPTAGMYLYSLHYVPSRKWDIGAMLSHIPEIGNETLRLLGENYQTRLSAAFDRIYFITELNTAAAEVAAKVGWHIFNREAMLATRPDRERMFIKDGVHLRSFIYPELLNVYYSLASDVIRQKRGQQSG